MSAPLPRVRANGWRRAVALLAAATVFPATGCSFLFLDRPREYAPLEKVDCTTAYGLPVLDAGLAALHVGSIALLSSASGDALGGPKARQTLAQGDFFWVVMHATSAVWGAYKVAQCKDLIADEQSAPYHPSPPPRPRPRPPRIEPPATPSPPDSAQPIAPVQPVPGASGPTATPPAAAPPAPPRPSVPQKADDE